MNAIAIPATLISAITPGAQPASMKIAQAPMDKGAADPNASASAGPFHALMQALSELDEKPRGKPPKKDQANDLATSEPAVPAKESKPPIVWALPQIPVSLELGAPKAAKGATRDARLSEIANGPKEVAGAALQPLWNILQAE